MNENKKLPCGMSCKLPRFCAGRACATCPLRRDTENTKSQEKEVAKIEQSTN